MVLAYGYLQAFLNHSTDIRMFNRAFIPVAIIHFPLFTVYYLRYRKKFQADNSAI